MTIPTKTLSAIGVAAALSLSLAACGSSSSTKSSTSTPSAASTAAIATIPNLTGMQTAVTLDTATIKALTGLGVTVAPEGKAHGVTLSDGSAVAFPITGGHVAVYPKTVSPYVVGELDHVGSGLTLTVGKKVLYATDFVVNPGTSMLSATIGAAATGGTAGVPLFALNGSKLVITPEADSSYHLDGTVVTLLPSAASAIDKFFGVKDGTVPPNAVIGTAHIVATA